MYTHRVFDYLTPAIDLLARKEAPDQGLKPILLFAYTYIVSTKLFPAPPPNMDLLAISYFPIAKRKKKLKPNRAE